MDAVPLFNIRRKDAGAFGAKGAQLGEIMSVGLPVPGGFVISCDAFTEFLKESGIRPQINELLDRLDEDNLLNLADISTEIQNLGPQVTIGEDLTSEVMQNLVELGAEYVAVRSSPVITVEGDVDELTLKMVTSLNVRKDNLLVNIKHCWLSLYSYRALEFLIKNGIDPDDVSVGVVVQEMVDSEISGVCYTTGEDRKDTEHIYIEAGWGLGEGLVSGIVSPDRCVLSKRTYKIAKYTVGTQMKEIVREEQKHKMVDVPLEKRQKRKLDNERAKTLARLCVQVEEYYGEPQVIEWAWDSVHDQFYILQARSVSEKKG